MKRFRRPLLAALVGLAAVLAISACSGGSTAHTTAATSVTSTGAILNGTGTCASGQTCVYWGRYGTGTDPSTWTNTATRTTTGTKTDSFAVTGLSASTAYNYEICGYEQSDTATVVCYDSAAQGVSTQGNWGSTTPSFTGFTTSAASSTVNWANGWGGYSNPSSLPGTNWRPYSDSAWVNRQLPASPTILSQSSSWVNDLFNNTRNGSGRPADVHVIPSSSSNDYQPPTYYSKASDPLYTIACSRTCAMNGYPSGTVQLHIPNGAAPATGGDHQMNVWDQAQGYGFSFYCIGTSLGTCNGATLSGGGTLYTYTAQRYAISGDARTGGCCIGTGAGEFREAELQNGSIPHALRMVNRCSSDPPIFPEWPGNPSGQTCVVPNGAYFWLDTATPPSSVPDWQQTILTTIHKYGIMVTDQGSNFAWDWQINDGPGTYAGGTNPYRTFAAAEVSKYGSAAAAQLSSNGASGGLDLLWGNIPSSWWSAHMHAVSPPCTASDPGC